MSNLNGLKPLIPYLLMAAMATIIILLYLITNPINARDRVWARGIGSSTANTKQNVNTRELARVLKKATMDDRTVIITLLDEEQALPGSIFDLFLESFHIGVQTEKLLKHLVVVAMDPTSFERCKSMHKHCFSVSTQRIVLSAEKRSTSHDYLKMLWWKLEFLKSVLELGYNFIYTDSDIMWLRNPISHFSNGANIVIAGDHSSSNSSSNCGFLHVKSSAQTIEFYKYWLMATVLYPGKNEQQIFNIIKQDSYASRIALEVSLLDTAHFGGLCQQNKDLSKVCTVHANCCIVLERKIYSLRVVLDDWKNYARLPEIEREKGVFSWRVSDKCSLSKFVI